MKSSSLKRLQLLAFSRGHADALSGEISQEADQAYEDGYLEGSLARDRWCEEATPDERREMDSNASSNS